MLKIIKGKKRPISKADFQYRLLKEDEMLHTGGKRKKVSLDELRRKPAGVGVLRNGGKEKQSTLRPRARIGKLSSRSAQRPGPGWGPPKNYESEKSQRRKCDDRIRETATRGKFADCLPVQLAIPAGSKQRQRGERHGMIGKEERNSHKTGFTERREQARRVCERHEVLRGGKKGVEANRSKSSTDGCPWICARQAKLVVVLLSAALSRP